MNRAIVCLAISSFLLTVGCVAPQTIELVSDPPNAHVEVDGQYIGQTPLQYTFESPLAEKIWPWEATLVARMSGGGYEDDVREFKRHDPLPEKVMFVLKPIHGAAPPPRRDPPPEPTRPPPSEFTPVDDLKKDL